MLASITPLGERARGRRWGLTTTAFLVAATTAGAASGALAAALGRLLLGGPPGAPGAVVLAAALLLGVALDTGLLGVGLPTVRRQVDEDWMTRYRGVVYGAGFGAQLGVGVATIVTSSAVYLAYLGAGLSAQPVVGLAVGGLFGVTRGASLLMARRVRDPAALLELHRRLGRRRRPTLTATTVLQLILAAALAAALVA